MDTIYSYLDNVNVSVYETNDNIDKWCNNNITSLGCVDVGFDTESKPIISNSNTADSHLLSIIQISTSTHVMICRVFNKPISVWSQELLRLLADEKINKYCIDSRQDETLLTAIGANIKGLVDLQPLINLERRVGMKECALTQLGIKLEKSKNIQAGDWSRYPLSIKQIEYAASDAVICLALAEHLNLCSPESKRLIRSLPPTLSQRKGDKQQVIISLLLSCIKFRKSSVYHDGFLLLDNLIETVEFRRLYTNLDEIKSIIINDPKHRFILSGNGYKLNK